MELVTGVKNVTVTLMLITQSSAALFQISEALDKGSIYIVCLLTFSGDSWNLIVLGEDAMASLILAT
jgi:hypothetical protein